MNYLELFEKIKQKGSFLCVGLDSDMCKIPAHFQTARHPLFSFNKEIIDATHDLAIAYKLNTAFYESAGQEGWNNLCMTIHYIKDKYPGIFIIADAKRGDIGNTSKMYADAFFSEMDADALTIAPYMGEDSVAPFLDYENKWVVLLALTSNKGSSDFQMVVNKENDKPLYQIVIEQSKKWADHNKMMYVVGATKAEMLKDIRKIIPEHFLLIPGVGAQGGSLKKVAEYGLNSHCGLIVNSSRGIIYADSTNKFADKAREKARVLQKEMNIILH